MWQLLISGDSSAYVELMILVALLAYFFFYRADLRHRVSRVSIIRLGIIVVVYLYLLLSWSSNITPAVRHASVFGMFLINLHLLTLIIQSRLERPYRDMLAAYCRDVKNQELLDRVWRTGKRFYYLRFLVPSLFSGVFPLKYLHEMASGRIIDDMQSEIRECLGERQFISLEGIAASLKTRLAEDGSLPADFKDVMNQAIDGFLSHPWIETQVNAYLRTAIEAPENIHNPDWSRMWEQATKRPGRV